VSHIIEHPKFSLKTYNYDFALLRFETPLVFDQKIKAVKLPKDGEGLQIGSKCKISGFGMTEDADVPEDLRSTEVKIMDDLRCKSNFQSVGFNVTSQMICAGEDNPGKKNGNRDACAGDSVI
jgi:trypsin